MGLSLRQGLSVWAPTMWKPEPSVAWGVEGRRDKEQRAMAEDKRDISTVTKQILKHAQN